MKTLILFIGFAFTVASQMSNCGSNSNGDECIEVNEVNASRLSNTSAKVSWSHSCLQCSSWKLGSKRKFLGVFPFWYSWETINEPLGNSFLGYDVVKVGLKKNKKYKFKVKANNMGVTCNSSTIGTSDQVDL